MTHHDKRGSKASAELLRKHGVGKHVKTLWSAVTDAWGVDWNEDYIARDILQNFRDAAKEQPSDVKVTAKGQDVEISGPTPFDLELFFYFVSTKGADDVGQYGEGFKTATVCLLRNH